MNIQNLYDEFERAKKGLGAASRMKRKEAIKHMLGHVSRSRARLHHAQNGTRPPVIYDIDFYARIAGIPCGIAIISEDEFFITDNAGRYAEWIERKMTIDEERRINRECIEFIKNKRDEARCDAYLNDMGLV